MAVDSRLLAEFKGFVRDLLALARADRAGLPDPWPRRADLMAVLDLHEDGLRRRLDRMRPAVDRAVWSASWQLRCDVADALDRCERAEREARWARED